MRYNGGAATSGIGTELKKPEVTCESTAEGRPEFVSSGQLPVTVPALKPSGPLVVELPPGPMTARKNRCVSLVLAGTFSLRVVKGSQLNYGLHSTMHHKVNNSLGVWISFFERGDAMNKALIASVALVALTITAARAADLPVKAPPPPPPVFSWTGLYVGANIGGAWANNNWTDTVFLTNFNNDNHNNGVFIGGGQIGGNYQTGNFVIGGEWDFDWAGNSNNNVTGVVIPGVGAIAVTNNNRWITTVAARFGYAVDHWLFYGKAGGGWVGNNNLTVTNVTTGVSLTCGNLANCGNNNTGGWLLGAGVEYAFTNNWTVKAEYDYLGLGNRTIVIPAAAPLLAGDTFTSNNRNIQMVKVGVNYLFNWGAPVAARY
jgi:outer membrane immunogenic protein